jgi:oxygen-independent coproporphyrinogen-3 oxidase
MMSTLTKPERKPAKIHQSLSMLDKSYPEPEAVRVLKRPENAQLLDYVSDDPFGSHVFPGDQTSTPKDFLTGLDQELSTGEPYFLWATIPICRYHCLYCQFPIVVQPNDQVEAARRARQWVDANLSEARVWLEKVPHLAETPVAEFCLFGGTPTLLPAHELARLLDSYRSYFNFTAETTIRVEGSPDSLTRSKLELLKTAGCQKLTFGVQTFNDRLLRLSNRLHSSAEAERAIVNANELEFARVDGDLIYGLLDQTVSDFESDLRRMIELDFTGIVITKLHLRPFEETGTAIAGVRAPWTDEVYRTRQVEKGHRWPALGEQYQMRELAVALLEAVGRLEYPTMYFQPESVGCGTWKAFVLDQDKQRPEVGIGLGGSSSTRRGSANISVDPKTYFAAVGAGVLPMEARRLDRRGEIVGSIRRALSTCQPLRDDLHRARFPESSIFNSDWGPVFERLELRGLALTDRKSGTVGLTGVGKTLVEAIMHTEIR